MYRLTKKNNNNLILYQMNTLPKFLFLTICLISAVSCNKENSKGKCEDCVIKIYECDKEDGEIRWKTNEENEVISSGYFYANQGGINETQQFFHFAGTLNLCSADFEGTFKNIPVY